MCSESLSQQSANKQSQESKPEKPLDKGINSFKYAEPCSEARSGVLKGCKEVCVI